MRTRGSPQSAETRGPAGSPLSGSDHVTRTVTLRPAVGAIPPTTDAETAMGWFRTAGAVVGGAVVTGAGPAPRATVVCGAAAAGTEPGTLAAGTGGTPAAGCSPRAVDGVEVS